jgi:AI-2 transport protein TqsA
MIGAESLMPEAPPVRKQAGSGIRVLLSLACAVIIVTGLKLAASLFIPVMLGLFLALLSMPILNWLDLRGLPRMVAVLLTVLTDLLILGGVIFLASGVMGDFQDKSSDYAERLRKQAAEMTETVDAQLERFGSFWQRTGESFRPPETDGATPAVGGSPDLSENREEELLEVAIPTFKDLFERYWDSNRVVALISQVDLVSRFTALASQSVFALIIMIFVLGESGTFAHKVRDVLLVRGPDLSNFQNTSRDIQKYLAIKTVISAITGLLATVTCFAFRVDFPLLWGMIAFLFNFVPAIGSIVAGIPPVLLALILHGFWPSMGVMACYLAINMTLGNFIEPMLLGDRFGLSTVIVILSVLVWGFIWGPVGMFLAVPLTMLVKVMLDNSSDLRWVSVFMAKGLPHPENLEEENPLETVSEPS